MRIFDLERSTRFRCLRSVQGCLTTFEWSCFPLNNANPCPVHELHRYRASAHAIRVTWPLGLRISKYIQKNLDTYRINLGMVWVQTSFQLVKCKNSNKPLKVSAQHNFQLRETRLGLRLPSVTTVKPRAVQKRWRHDSIVSLENTRKYGLSKKLDSRFHRSISENFKASLSNVPWARVGNFWQSESIKSLSFWKGLRRSRRHFDRHRM